MPFCYSPWTNVDISPQGHIAPCCKFRHALYDNPALSIETSSLSEYLNSPTLQIVRKDFEQNRWPVGCERCQIEEANGIKSKRILDLDRWEQYYSRSNLSVGNFLTASIAFGNTCNLSCVTCGPYSSSRWQQDHKSLFGIDIKPTHFYRTGFVDEFASQVPNLVHLDIPGGEPFLSAIKTQKDLLLKLRQTGRSQEIGLHYTTNATIFPDNTWWEIWKDFREIDMQLSIDGIGSRFEYIRFPARWSEVLANIERYQSAEKKHTNLRISVSHTVSAFNIFYLGTFVAWCREQGLPEPWLGRVHDPKYQRPTVWPFEAREHIISYLKSFQDPLLEAWISVLSTADDSQEWPKFKMVADRLDQIRGVRFSTAFPEMMEFYEKKI